MNRQNLSKLLVIDHYLTDLEKVFSEIELDNLTQIIEILEVAKENNKQIFFIGNGGSSATASHAVCDLTKTILGSNPSNSSQKPFKVINLSDNVPSLTAWANDVGYESIFSGQLKAFANEGDILVAISASGNSPNILQTVNFAKELGLTTVGWTGFDGGKLKELSDYNIHIPSTDYGVVEDLHMILVHIITRYFKQSNDES